METIFNIQDGVLKSCQVKEKEITIPAEVTTIAFGVFKSCELLEKVTILGPADIEAEAFWGCKNLREVNLADGVKSIGNECFGYCEKLDKLYIPESVEKIGWDIACMNDSSYRHPHFYCYRQGIGPKWNKHWNRCYNDPRWPNDDDHTSYHQTFFGMNRDLTPRTDIQKEPIEGVEHGTGIELSELPKRGVGRRLPDTKVKLWLTATILNADTGEEYRLSNEEKETLEYLLFKGDAKGAEMRHLDEPWETVINSDTYHFAPEVDINAWINRWEDDVYDGHSVVVHHDMPWHIDPHEDYPISLLTENSTIIAEREIWQNNAVYDVRLHIQWFKQERKEYSIKQLFELLGDVSAQLADYKDDKNEIEIELAKGREKAESYKFYKPSAFPAQFIEDLKADKSLQRIITQVVIQPYEFYEELHSFSDDYKDAAEAYGQDCSDWYTTEHRPTGQRINFEIKN